MSKNERNGFLAKRVSGKVTVEQLLSFAFGVFFVTVLLILAVVIPEISEGQELIFRIVLALAAAGVGAMIPGLLNVEMKASNHLQIRAAGALAVFVIVFLLNPPRWVTRGENEAQPGSDKGAMPMVQDLELRTPLDIGQVQGDDGATLDPVPGGAFWTSWERTEGAIVYQRQVVRALTTGHTPLQSAEACVGIW
ncbi:MAG: hypothetical protein JXA14_18790 [Anaerolineae bacterium]|nr:hypothetical protein [Anaerolineae bacterium]